MSGSSSTQKQRNRSLYDASSSPALKESAARAEASDLDDSFILLNEEEERKKLQRLRRRQSMAKNAVEEEISDKPANSAYAGLSENDRAAHFNLCMKLAQENKVNPKNAFDLYAIDYLSDLIKKKETNFQMASMALQASAQIYAARVDMLHSTCLQFSSNLTAKKGKKSGPVLEDCVEEEPLPTDNAPANAPRKSTKKKKGKRFIADNPESINYTKLETVEMPHPKSNILNAAFEEGGLGGLLFHLPVKDDTCEVMLNDSSPYVTEKKPCVISPNPKVPIEIIQNMHKKILQNKNMEAFPSLKDFSFFRIKYPLDSETTLPCEEHPLAKQVNALFEKAAAEESLNASVSGPDLVFDNPQTPGPLFGAGDLSVAEFNNMDSTDDIPTGGADANMNSSVGEVPEADLQSSPPMFQASSYIPPTPSGTRKLTVDDFISRLSFKPNDYSCFIPGMELQAVGANILKGKTPRGGRRESKTVATAKKPKDVIKDFDDLIAALGNIDHKFTVGKNTVVSARVIDGWDPAKNIALPPSEYDRKKLMEFFTTHFSGWQELEATEKPNETEEAEHMDDFLDDNRYDDDVQEELSETTNKISLVPAPEKVKKDTINFAKIAKRVDMKEVKHVLWKVLRTDEGTSLNSETEDERSAVPEQVTKPVDFGDAYHRLCSKLSSESRENISTSIAFVALLHLSNEHNLSLQSSEDMKTLTINQG